MNRRAYRAISLKRNLFWSTISGVTGATVGVRCAHGKYLLARWSQRRSLLSCLKPPASEWQMLARYIALPGSSGISPSLLRIIPPASSSSSCAAIRRLSCKSTIHYCRTDDASLPFSVINDDHTHQRLVIHVNVNRASTQPELPIHFI